LSVSEKSCGGVGGVYGKRTAASLLPERVQGEIAEL